MGLPTRLGLCHRTLSDLLIEESPARNGCLLIGSCQGPCRKHWARKYGVIHSAQNDKWALGRLIEKSIGIRARLPGRSSQVHIGRGCWGSYCARAGSCLSFLLPRARHWAFNPTWHKTWWLH